MKQIVLAVVVQSKLYTSELCKLNFDKIESVQAKSFKCNLPSQVQVKIKEFYLSNK